MRNLNGKGRMQNSDAIKYTSVLKLVPKFCKQGLKTFCSDECIWKRMVNVPIAAFFCRWCKNIISALLSIIYMCYDVADIY